MTRDNEKQFTRAFIRFMTAQVLFSEHPARERYFTHVIRETEKEMFSIADAESLHLEEALEERINT